MRLYNTKKNTGVNTMFVNYKKGKRCPICGKSNDFCGYQQTQGQLWIGCHVELDNDPGTCITGIDGKIYRMMYLKNEVAMYQPLAQYEAYINRQKEHPAPVRQKKANQKKEPENPYQGLAPVDHRDRIYRKLLNQCELSEFHKNLLRRDGWTEAMINDFGATAVSITPKQAKELSSMFLADEIIGVPGFFGTDQAEIALSHSSMMIPIWNEDKKIIALRLRPDWHLENVPKYADNKNKLPKYLWFSSYKHSGKTTKNLLINGTSCKPRVGWYYQDTDVWDTVLITEGEKKAFVCNHILHIPALSLPGVSQYNALLCLQECGKSIMDLLLERQVKTLIIGEDMDLFQKKEVKRAVNTLIKVLCSYPLSVYWAIWDYKCGKGLDDFLLQTHERPLLKKIK